MLADVGFVVIQELVNVRGREVERVVDDGGREEARELAPQLEDLRKRKRRIEVEWGDMVRENGVYRVMP